MVLSPYLYLCLFQPCVTQPYPRIETRLVIVSLLLQRSEVGWLFPVFVLSYFSQLLTMASYVAHGQESGVYPFI